MPLTQELFLAIVLNILVYLLVLNWLEGRELNQLALYSFVSLFVIYYFVTPLYFTFKEEDDMGDEENYFELE